MSVGSKAGIGVGAAIGGLLALGGVGWLMHRLGRRSVQGRQASSLSTQAWRKPGVDEDSDVVQPPVWHEVAGDSRHQQGGNVIVYHEAPVNNGYSELGG
ncbi:hypothetical protein HJFPF1_03960 [Paramyrothecium foliicola]|nr:hypothetical protein HJFPF1_03960 [Paramyrothecium foliicola]